MRKSKRVKYNDPLKRLKWVPVFWCLVLLAAANFGWNALSKDMDKYYASLPTAAGDPR